MKRSVVTGVFALGTLTASVVAAWQSSVLISATVWGHKFSEVEVSSAGCDVTTTLEYAAPHKAYKSRLKGMNQYRFKARARFASGKTAVSQVFSSSKPGRQSHSYTFDTKPQGCWAKREQILRGVDVEGCRGEGCQVEPFK